jgi:hypothetical protein
MGDMKITKTEKFSTALFIVWLVFVLFLTHKMRGLMEESTRLKILSEKSK